VEDQWADEPTLPYTGSGPGGGFGDVGRYADGLLQSLTGRNPNLLEAADEVAADQTARIWVVSLERELARCFLACLRRDSVACWRGPFVHHGVWMLAALPAGDPNDGAGTTPDAEDDPFGRERTGEQLLAQLGEFPPDIVLYLAGLGQAWRADDTAWVARLRTLGAPLLPVLVEICVNAASQELDTAPAASPEEARAALAATVRQLAGVKPAFVTIDQPPARTAAYDQPPADVAALVQRIAALRPRVAVALAQDMAWCRPMLAQRIIRTGALFTALVSAQPAPLLDLPFQIALQWKVAMQLAAIYGRPGLDYRSREMMGTIAWNLLIRFVMQQAARFVPVMGWLISAGIGWISTTLLGHGLVAIYENEDRWNLEQQRVLARANAAVTPVRDAAVSTMDAMRGRAAALVARGGRLSGAVRMSLRRDKGSEDDAPTAEEAAGPPVEDGVSQAAAAPDAAQHEGAAEPPPLPIANQDAEQKNIGKCEPELL
jgi:uncharacterized protein (DUF697 family)